MISNSGYTKADSKPTNRSQHRQPSIVQNQIFEDILLLSLKFCLAINRKQPLIYLFCLYHFKCFKTINTSYSNEYTLIILLRRNSFTFAKFHCTPFQWGEGDLTLGRKLSINSLHSIHNCVNLYHAVLRLIIKPPCSLWGLLTDEF